MPSRGPREGMLAEIQRRAGDFLDGRQPLFDRRINEGQIVDGHGDLLAGDIFCLDFDDRLRWLDSPDDVSFLVMDLDCRGHPDLARHLADDYAASPPSPGPPRCATTTWPTARWSGPRSTACDTSRRGVGSRRRPTPRPARAGSGAARRHGAPGARRGQAGKQFRRINGHLHLRALHDTLQRITETVGASRIKPSTQPNDHRAATEVPRSSGQPPVARLSTFMCRPAPAPPRLWTVHVAADGVRC
ncbi:MAG: hypothetical protein GEV09_12430 [Pseudonocardiaceae bacterium]|nr:hypothetical protein [Pseudonocardiaceae bacterium]